MGENLSRFNCMYMHNGVGGPTLVDVAVKPTLAANTVSCVECDLIYVASTTVRMDVIGLTVGWAVRCLFCQSISWSICRSFYFALF